VGKGGFPVMVFEVRDKNDTENRPKPWTYGQAERLRSGYPQAGQPGANSGDQIVAVSRRGPTRPVKCAGKAGH
jgi:hypothetical protein